MTAILGAPPSSHGRDCPSVVDLFLSTGRVTEVYHIVASTAKNPFAVDPTICIRKYIIIASKLLRNNQSLKGAVGTTLRQNEAEV